MEPSAQEGLQKQIDDLREQIENYKVELESSQEAATQKAIEGATAKEREIILTAELNGMYVIDAKHMEGNTILFHAAARAAFLLNGSTAVAILAKVELVDIGPMLASLVFFSGIGALFSGLSVLSNYYAKSFLRFQDNMTFLSNIDLSLKTARMSTKKPPAWLEFLHPYHWMISVSLLFASFVNFLMVLVFAFRWANLS